MIQSYVEIGKFFVLKKISEHICNQFIEIDTVRPNQEGSLNDISPELLQLILSLLSHGKHKKFGLSDIAYKKFVNQLARDFPRDRVPLILAPLIYTEDTEVSAEKMSANSQGILTSAIMDTSWSNLVMDIGKYYRTFKIIYTINIYLFCRLCIYSNT